VNLGSIALSNLRRRKGRAAFLVAGLLIGVATVVALLTLTDALTREAQDNLDSFGANILITPQSDALSLAYGGVAVGGVAVGQTQIREADLSAIDSIANRANIATISPKLLGGVRANGQDALLMGVRPGDEFKLKQWWTVDGYAPRAANELVAGSAVAAQLDLQIGDAVQIAGRDFVVSGLLRETGSEDDNVLIAELPAVQAVLGKPGEVTMVEVAAQCSNCPVGMITEQIQAVMPGTKVTALQQVVKNRMHSIEQFKTYSYAAAGVIVVIEILVVFLTMMGAVSERTREIGIFRAIGFRRRHVTGLILIEALAASLVAGVFGYLAGMAVSRLVLPLVAEGGGVYVAWTPLLGAGAVALALAVGALASLYPALHASRMDPTEALRAL